jgi:hypothetical protein
MQHAHEWSEIWLSARPIAWYATGAMTLPAPTHGAHTNGQYERNAQEETLMRRLVRT